MKISHLAVIGGRGWLGQAIVRAGRRRGLSLTVVSRTAGPGVVACDPTDPASLARALARADVVINAAGFRGADAPQAVRTNYKVAEDVGRLAVVEGWRLVHVGSAAEYGPADAIGGVDPTSRIGEDHPCAPSSLYGMTKLAGTRAVVRWRAEGADAVVARVFNLAAADLPNDNPIRDLAGQVRRAAEAGTGEGVVEIGDPDTVRDISRRSWAAAALVALATWPKPTLPVPVVNVCSGRPTSFSQLARAMGRHLGVEPSIRDLGWPRGGHIVGDPGLLRSLVELPAHDRIEDLVRSVLGPRSSVPVLVGDDR